MVEVVFEPAFEKKVSKIRDLLLKTRVKKKIAKIVNSPAAGKPMRNMRKGTREVYIPPFRLSYRYIAPEDKIIFADLYHKDKQ